MVGSKVAHYRIEQRLGAGGMGMVYKAVDTRLERTVALKEIHAGLEDSELRERFWREARAAAAIDHPSICQVFELLEHEGRLFLVMEFLEGETLDSRLARGPMSVVEAVDAALPLLDALAKLHERRLVHRDLKPSNVFLTRDGRIKLLDFGLVHKVDETDAGRRTPVALTMTTVGSPGYMAPEQVRGEPVDGRTDLFALALILHEAVTGERVFTGTAPAQLMYAVLNTEAPRLSGSRAFDALGAVLERALRKTPALRYTNAAEMAAALRATRDPSSTEMMVARDAPPAVRLAVLPFQLLRPDPERDFLCTSLADAIALSLAGLRSLVVRSPAAAARFSPRGADLGEIAHALDVNAVLFGTLLPAGERCRVTAQLVEAPGGQVVWSQTTDLTHGDVFQLQDALTQRIVESLQVPLSARERRGLHGNVPANAAAYEMFLRANRVSGVIGRDLVVARDLYRQAVAADPAYAPAWARLGRCYRVMAKYLVEGDRSENFRLAEEAFRRAIALVPDLPVAHHLYAHLEIDRGQFEDALERLLEVVQRNPNDPEGYAGLIAAYRYADMIEDSAIAFHHVRRLDPTMRTSMMYTYLTTGEFERALAEAEYGDYDLHARVLLAMGRRDEALRLADAHAAKSRGTLEETWFRTTHALASEDPDAFRRAVARFEDFPDPEGRFLCAEGFAVLGAFDEARRWLISALDEGYCNLTILHRLRSLDPLRGDAAFDAAVERARVRSQAARARFGGRLQEPAAAR
jgi:TolB-like protein/tetratricopeptide (TPR) repeat protein/tRNA A-37 threonylcarbamoyl transferase component Bud32